MLVNFHPFHKAVSLLCNIMINKNKSLRCTKAELRHDITVETSRILIDCLTVNLEIVSRQYRNNNQYFAWSSCVLHVFFFGGEGGVFSFAAGCLLTFPSHSVSAYSKNSCSDNF